MQKIMILNGPNLNKLGRGRCVKIYGTKTLEEIENMCKMTAKAFNIMIDFKQSNHEGELIDWLQEIDDHYIGLLINPGALAHSSIALHDALLDLSIPIIEIHLSNIFKREEFRRSSLISPAVQGLISGLQYKGYILALKALAQEAGLKELSF